MIKIICLKTKVTNHTYFIVVTEYININKTFQSSNNLWNFVAMKNKIKINIIIATCISILYKLQLICKITLTFPYQQTLYTSYAFFLVIKIIKRLCCTNKNFTKYYCTVILHPRIDLKLTRIKWNYYPQVAFPYTYFHLYIRTDPHSVKLSCQTAI